MASWARSAIASKYFPTRLALARRVAEWMTLAALAAKALSALAPEGKSPTDSTLYLCASGTAGLSVAGPWDGLGMRANASAPMILEDCEFSRLISEGMHEDLDEGWERESMPNRASASPSNAFS